MGVAIRPEPAGPVHEVADFRRRPSSNGLLNASPEESISIRLKAAPHSQGSQGSQGSQLPALSLALAREGGGFAKTSFKYS